MGKGEADELQRGAARAGAADQSPEQRHPRFCVSELGQGIAHIITLEMLKK